MTSRLLLALGTLALLVFGFVLLRSSGETADHDSASPGVTAATRAEAMPGTEPTARPYWEHATPASAPATVTSPDGDRARPSLPATSGNGIAAVDVIAAEAHAGTSQDTSARTPPPLVATPGPGALQHDGSNAAPPVFRRTTNLRPAKGQQAPVTRDPVPGTTQMRQILLGQRK